MKKFLLSLALVIPMVFTSCGDDNDEATLSLDKGAVEVDYQKTVTIKASEKDCTWSSENEFVATVDQNGVVTGKHVGTTKITAFWHGREVSCVVKVNATNFDFILPCLQWGSTQAFVKDFMKDIVGPTLDIENSTSLGYATNGDFPMYTYSFNSNLTSSALFLSYDTDQDRLEDFIAQRFVKYAEDDDYIYLRNEASPERTTLQYGPNEDVDGVMLLFAPTRIATKGNNSIEEIIATHNTIAKQLK